MIIESATKFCDETGKDYYDNWVYFKFVVNGNVFRIIFEYNDFYGYLIRQWSINNITSSNVKHKYCSGNVSFDCSNGLCGNRPFEHDWMVWELLLKPIGFEYHQVAEFNDKCISKTKLIELMNKFNIKWK
jgi:hypothetical protein